MKNLPAIAFLLLIASASGMAAAKTIDIGDWRVVTDDSAGSVTAVCKGDTILNRSIAVWGDEEYTVSMADCGRIKTTVRKKHPTVIGEASVVAMSGKLSDGTVATLELTFPERGSSMLAQLQLSGAMAERGVDYLTPVCNTASIPFVGADNRQLSVPYDNDAWVRYAVTPFGEAARESIEVGAMIDAASRRAVVAGSIDHDMWKSAVKYVTTSPARVDSLIIYSGAASEITRDVRRHGKVRGTKVASARFVLSVVGDWRDGLEMYADLCAAVSPNRMKGGPRPFGWNSWGDLQTKINYENACQVSDFIKNNLSSRSFHSADSTVVIDLDAFWDFGLNDEQRRLFVEHCKANGQKPGIYYCPFTDWGKNPDAVLGEDPRYKMGDMYLCHDGNPIVFDGAPALDPTHPGTRIRIKRQLEQFIEWGYEYVKIDFMAHGAYESDAHYAPEVMTGTQAYNSGMQYIDSIVADRMWVNLSIAPLFPACYAQSRRIGCDAWSNIGSTEYTLNALTYGWWLDHVYHYNDADHIVFKGVSEGENRARLLSSAITGIYFLGDDYSATGDSLTLERAKRMVCVDKINDMARRTKSFRPLRLGDGERAADIFEGRDGSTVWVAVFNYDEDGKAMAFGLGELGLRPDDVKSMTELWSGVAVQAGHDGSVTLNVPGKDAGIIEIVLK